MKTSIFLPIFLVTLILSSLVSSVPLTKSQRVPVVRYNESNDHKGNYSFEFELADGTRKAEEGCLKFVAGKPVTVKTGKYSWISPEGIRFTVIYTADETGFHSEITTNALPASEILHLHSSGFSDIPVSKGHSTQISEIPISSVSSSKISDFPNSRVHAPEISEVPEILSAHSSDISNVPSSRVQSSKISDFPNSRVQSSEKNAPLPASGPQSSRPTPPASSSSSSSPSPSPSPSLPPPSFYETSEEQEQQPSYYNYDESAPNYNLPPERSSYLTSSSTSSPRPILPSYTYPTPSSSPPPPPSSAPSSYDYRRTSYRHRRDHH